MTLRVSEMKKTEAIFFSDASLKKKNFILQARLAKPFFVSGLVQYLGIWAFYHTPSAKCQIR